MTHPMILTDQLVHATSKHADPGAQFEFRRLFDAVQCLVGSSSTILCGLRRADSGLRRPSCEYQRAEQKQHANFVEKALLCRCDRPPFLRTQIVILALAAIGLIFFGRQLPPKGRRWRTVTFGCCLSPRTMDAKGKLVCDLLAVEQGSEDARYEPSHKRNVRTPTRCAAIELITRLRRNP